MPKAVSLDDEVRMGECLKESVHAIRLDLEAPQKALVRLVCIHVSSVLFVVHVYHLIGLGGAVPPPLYGAEGNLRA